MKNREIFLDFTSLLDVIMIILFFFILFSTFEIDEATKAANQTKAEYETKVDEAEEMLNEYEKEKDRLLSIDENALKNQEALSMYDNNQGLSINLIERVGENGLFINILKGDEKLRELNYDSSHDYNAEFLDVIKSAGYNPDDVIICNLTYNGDNLGSAQAVEQLEKAVYALQKDYDNFYFASINISK